jgi:hypothetical protein
LKRLTGKPKCHWKIVYRATSLCLSKGFNFSLKQERGNLNGWKRAAEEKMDCTVGEAAFS